MGPFAVPVGSLDFASSEAVFPVGLGAVVGVVERVGGVVQGLLPVPLCVGLSGLLSAYPAGQGQCPRG